VLEKHLTENDNKIKEYIQNRRNRFEKMKQIHEKEFAEAEKSLKYYSNALEELENKLKTLTNK
ncbi:hypothetical protein ACFLSV_02010, partial [Bacteroidota bacterium]